MQTDDFQMPRAPASTKPLFFAGRVDLDVFVRFDNTANCVNAGRHADSSQLGLPACVVALLSARTCLTALSRTGGLCCDVPVVDARRHAVAYQKNAPQDQKGKGRWHVK